MICNWPQTKSSSNRKLLCDLAMSTALFRPQGFFPSVIWGRWTRIADLQGPFPRCWVCGSKLMNEILNFRSETEWQTATSWDKLSSGCREEECLWLLGHLRHFHTKLPLWVYKADSCWDHVPHKSLGGCPHTSLWALSPTYIRILAPLLSC